MPKATVIEYNKETLDVKIRCENGDVLWMDILNSVKAYIQSWNQKPIIQSEFEKLAVNFGYINGAEAFRTMRTFHRKYKTVQW